VSAHLGNRVSALLDGQLGEAETDRAWDHVHQCHLCRDLVEREGWVKTRLASWSTDGTGCGGLSTELKGALLGMPPGDVLLAMASQRTTPGLAGRRRAVGLAALGGGAAGMAVMGVLAIGVAVAPADAPQQDRRVPVAPSHVFTSVNPNSPVKLPARDDDDR
jgi:hypothetical protein